MKTAFCSSFGRDLKKIEDRLILDQVRQMILDVENAPNLRAIDNLRVPVQTPSPQPSPTRGEGVRESPPCATKTLIVREGSEQIHLRKMSGGEKYFRIRVSDYRIGIVVEGDEIEFVRCLHRRDIYRFFP